MHRDEQRQLYDGRPLLYLEQSMGEWFLRYGRGVPLLIPAPRQEVIAQTGAEDFVDVIDGLVVQGGVDMAPESYGDQPLRREWSGDAVRDAYELELIEHCLRRDRPVLGICRGHQVLNVALGGTLYQDIETQVGTEVTHRDGELYHENSHRVEFVEGSTLAQVYGVRRGEINSVHHQAIRELGEGLVVEARCPEDGVIEAVWLEGRRYARGIQWHPEFQERRQLELLSPEPLLDDFYAAICRRKNESTHHG